MLSGSAEHVRALALKQRRTINESCRVDSFDVHFE